MELVKVCPSCGAENPKRAPFCSCRANLTAVSPSPARSAAAPAEETPAPPNRPSSARRRCPDPDCGALNAAGSMDCAYCQTPLDSAAAAEPSGATRADPGRGAAEAAARGPDPDGTRRDIPFVVHFPFERVEVRDRLAIGRDLSFSPLAASLQDLDKVSRRHAELRVVDGELQVIDLGSTNAVYINDERIAQHAPRVVKAGDRLSFSSQLKAHIGE